MTPVEAHSMTHDQLKSSIANVRELMQTALDGKERDLLGGILTHIVSDDHDPLATADVGKQLDVQAVAFESSHPMLARALREVMDVLNKMGL